VPQARNTDVARSASSFEKLNCVPTAVEILPSRQHSSLVEFGRSSPPRIPDPLHPPSSCSSSTTALVPLLPPQPPPPPPPPAQSPAALACDASMCHVFPTFSDAAPPPCMVSRRVLVYLLSGPHFVENLKESHPPMSPVSLGAGHPSHLLPVPCTLADAPQNPPSLPLIRRPSPLTRVSLSYPRLSPFRKDAVSLPGFPGTGTRHEVSIPTSSIFGGEEAGRWVWSWVVGFGGCCGVR
jgi:hypothetical protein